jgi:hypothetical protein
MPEKSALSNALHGVVTGAAALLGAAFAEVDTAAFKIKEKIDNAHRIIRTIAAYPQ